MPSGGAGARIAVLVSGQGRNLQALIEACIARRIPGPGIVGVLSNRAAAPALDRAREAGIPTQVIAHQDWPSRAAFDQALTAALDALQPDIVVLAGFMRVLGDDFVRRYAGRMINIHPSLLPRHPGLDTHRRALEAGETEHGATVHYVTRELDGGAPVIQGRVSVRPQDIPENLASRVMNEVEIRILPQAVAWMADGALCLRGSQAVLRGVPIRTPLQLSDLEDPFR